MKITSYAAIFVLILVFPVMAEKPLPSPEIQKKLIGRWIRPDGGYVIHVQEIKADGSVEAAYFNPGQVHVSQANVGIWKGFDQLLIKLDDKGYQGSTYTLYYYAEKDTLPGFYYQAPTNKTFEVLFIREK